MHHNKAAIGDFKLTRAMVKHILPKYGSIDISAYNLDSGCGAKSDPIKVMIMCDLERSTAPTITFASQTAPAGGVVNLKWAPLPAVQKGELFKVNWYTSLSDGHTYHSDSFEHRSDIT